MNDTKALLEALGKPFPREAVRTREGSRGKGFDYVAGHTIIHRLNDATGGRWDWDIKSFDFRPLPPTNKGKEQWLVVVTGTLGIPGLGNRSGVGVQVVIDGAGEDLVKGASTDALKKAATLFGVALELYGDDYEDEDYGQYHGSQAPYQKYDTGSAPLTPNRPPQPVNGARSNGSAPARAPQPPTQQRPPQTATAMPEHEFVAFFEEQARQFKNGTERPYIQATIAAKRAEFSAGQYERSLSWWGAFTKGDDKGMARALSPSVPSAPAHEIS